MKKFTFILSLLLAVVITAKADFTTTYTTASKWIKADNLADGLLTVVTNHGNDGSVCYRSYDVEVSADCDVTATFTYTGGSDKIVILGVELLNADGTVVVADYHEGSAGGSHVNNSYSLEGVSAGKYEVRCFVCDKDGDHDLSSTNGNIEFKGNITEKYLAVEPISTDYLYKIQNVAYSRMLCATDDYAAVTSTKDITDLTQLWAFEATGTDGVYKLRNYGKEKYLGHNATTGQAWPVNTEGSEFEVKVSKNPTKNELDVYYVIKHEGDEYSHAHDANWGKTEQIVRWLPDAAASQWILIKTELSVSEIPQEFTYSVKYNGKEVAKQTVSTFVGESFPAMTSLPYGVSVAVPTREVAAEDNGTTIELEATIDLPFEFAESYENVNWKFLKFDSNNNYYLYHDASKDHVALDVKSVAVADVENANYYWGFVGNPFDGFKVVNKGAGEGYVLSSSTTIPEGTTGQNTWPIMTATPVPDGNNTLWVATAGAVEKGFFLAQKDYPANRMNNRGKLAYWTEGAGTGSTFIIEDPEITIAAIVDNMKTVAISGLGYVGGYNADLKDEIESLSTLTGIAQFQAENKSNIVAFDVNKYYRIQNVFRNHVISVDANTNRVAVDQNSADVNQLWKFENAVTDGTYFIKSANAKASMQAAGADNKLVAEGAEFELYNLSEGSGQFNLKQKNNANLMCEYGSGGIGSWSGGGIGSDMAWYIIPVNEIEIAVEGLATIYLPFAVEVGGDAKVYAVKDATNEEAVLAEKADVPAEQGAIIVGNGTVKLNIIDAAVSDWTGNKLAGTLVDTDLTTAAYALSGEGFAKTELTDGKYALSANQAYLPTGELTADALPLNFTGVPTAIDAVETENAEQVIYDLTGRRVEKITEAGIYIVNGNKVLVR